MKKESLSNSAYDQLEAMIVDTRLAPGMSVTLQKLQDISGFGRTPVHDAVKRLATNRLIYVQPRSGLRIAPVNIEQERTLLPLRIEMEALACRLATERCSARDRKILSRFISDLEHNCQDMTLEAFNVTDRLLNIAMLNASGEPLLENTLSPLQTLYRRTGWLFMTYTAPPDALQHTIGAHVELMRTVLANDAARTEKFVRKMVGEVFDLLDQVQQNIDPGLLDISLADLDVRTGVQI